MVKKVTFIGFKGVDRPRSPQSPPLDPPLRRYLLSLK